MENQVKTWFLSIILHTMLGGAVRSLNYGPLTPSYFRGVSAATEEVKVKMAVENNTMLGPQNMPSRSSRPYTIFYSLNYPQNRGGKYLNFSLQTESPENVQVQPRIMNQPNFYPNFGSGESPNRYNPDTLVSTVLQTSNNANDVRILNILESYNISKNNRFTPPSKSYAPEKVPRFTQTPALFSRSPDAGLMPLKNNYKGTDILPTMMPGQNVKPLGTVDLTPPQIYNKPAGIPPLSLGYNQKDRGSVIPSPRYQVVDNPSSSPEHTRIPGGRFRTLPQPYNNRRTYVPTVTPSTNTKPEEITCICIPYYLCKNGIINSGGRLSQRRKSRDLNYRLNSTVESLPSQAKIMNLYPQKAVPEINSCGPNRICCQIGFEGSNGNSNDDDYYPVATPAPETYYPVPPRFPNRKQEVGICGKRKAYGVQARLGQPQYPGDASEFGEYPWQVAVLKKIEDDKNLYLCGGVLISSQWVATAAHCVKKEKNSYLVIRLGEWDVNRKDEVYPFIEEVGGIIVTHPEFNPETLENDLALIKIQNPVDPNVPHVTHACLPRPGQVFEDQECWVSGWGKDFFGSQGEYQNVLKEVDVPVVSRSTCIQELRSTKLGPDYLLHPGFLCAGGEAGKDACTGDGGSPLVCKSEGSWYVVGLVSWGIGCGMPGIPGVYVNVLYYIDWIDSIIWR